MNSGVPGSPCKRGPPLQAYQKVLVVPSARRLTERLIPLRRTRISRQPIVQRSAGGAALITPGDDDDLTRCGLDLNALDGNAFGLRGTKRALQIRLAESDLSHPTMTFTTGPLLPVRRAMSLGWITRSRPDAAAPIAHSRRFRLSNA